MNCGRALQLYKYVASLRKSIYFKVPILQMKQVLKPFSVSCHFPRYLLSSVIPSVLIIRALVKDKTNVIKEADNLYDENKFEALHDVLLPHKDSKEPEILWRLARAIFEKCRSMEQKEKLNALEEALALVGEALRIDENCWAAHKWRAILLDYVWRFKSTKGRIIHSFEVKKHMERAIELNPQDSTSFYLLGEWCFTFADMPWYQRKVAAAIFASPPTSTYEEALKYFEKAEEVTPLFYSMNLLMLAKCWLKLNNQEKAIMYLKQARNYPVKTADDRQAHTEAGKLLKELKAEF